MERMKSLAAAFPLLWITFAACTGSSPAQPTPSSPPATQVDNVPSARPSPPMPDARSLTAGVLVDEELRRTQDPSCPGTSTDFIRKPCLHFNFVAPRTGILRVSVTWSSPLYAVGLVVGEIKEEPFPTIFTPKVMRVRVVTGENYLLTTSLLASHDEDYEIWKLPFQLIATME